MESVYHTNIVHGVGELPCQLLLATGRVKLREIQGDKVGPWYCRAGKSIAQSHVKIYSRSSLDSGT